jgi:hypothetical protein
MTEAVLEQILSPGRHVISPALTCPEPSRRPGTVLHGVDVTTDVVQHGRDCLLGQLLDQPEQFIALHAHELSVRIVSAGNWHQQRAHYLPIGRSTMVIPGYSAEEGHDGSSSLGYVRGRVRLRSALRNGLPDKPPARPAEFTPAD